MIQTCHLMEMSSFVSLHPMDYGSAFNKHVLYFKYIVENVVCTLRVIRFV